MGKRRRPGKRPLTDPPSLKEGPPRWIAVKDDPPKDQQVVVCWSEPCGIDIMCCEHNKGEDKDLFGPMTFTSQSGYLSGDVTHWMPLPEYVIKRLIEFGYV